jgi:DNA-binding response OmpR family regulator
MGLEQTLKCWVFVHGKPGLLTKKGVDLLIYLISNKDKVLTKESIVEHLRGDYIDFGRLL